MKKLLIVLCVVVLAGCGSATKHYLRNNPDAIPVSFTVNLDKEFVKNISTLGGGQAAMLILVGPFTNNAVLLEAKEMIDIGERIAFHQWFLVPYWKPLTNLSPNYASKCPLISSSRLGSEERHLSL